MSARSIMNSHFLYTVIFLIFDFINSGIPIAQNRKPNDIKFWEQYNQRAETVMFVNIWIRCFDIWQMTSLVIYAFRCAPNAVACLNQYTSAGGLWVPKVIICPVASASALTWFNIYIYLLLKFTVPRKCNY
jgi:hypothetical protein